MSEETKSSTLYKTASGLMPGGVNSPVRAFKSVGGDPIFMKRGEGSSIEDVDGRKYIDYVCSWGPLILGHAHPSVVAAVISASERGLSFGAPTEGEVVLAGMVVEAFDSIDSIRLVNSGTEAVASAVRLARAVTRRDVVVKMEGCYHGSVDGLLVKAGSGPMTLGVPTSAGLPEAVIRDTIVVPYNDISTIQEVVESRGEQIAAVIVEPIPANMGLVLPEEGYLEVLRELTEEYGIQLIFDEVVSGFRIGYGGAQSLYGVTPDITVLGKILGGGMPVGAYGGRKALMDEIAPLGSVYQAGTLSGNPVAVAAGIETLRQLQLPGVYEQLEERTTRLARGIREAAERASIGISVNCLASCLSVFFTNDRVTNYETAAACDSKKFAQLFHALLKAGVYLPPSPFETMFVSAAHSDSDIDETLSAFEQAFEQLGA